MNDWAEGRVRDNDLRFTATAHNAVHSPFGFEMTSLYAPQSDGFA